MGSSNPGPALFWKVDANGELEQKRFVPGGGDDAGIGVAQIAWSVSLTDDNAYITTGLRFPDTSNQYNKHDVGLTKFDVDGEVVWHSAFGESWASHDEGRAVIQTSDGGYIIAGRTKPDNIADYRLWLIKTDTEGNMEWENESFVMSTGLGIVEASDGGFIIVGPGGVIAKTNSSGQFEGEVGGVRSSFAKQGYSVNQKGRLMTVTYPALIDKSGFSLGLFDLKGKSLGRSFFKNGRATWSVPQGLSGVIVLKFNVGQGSFTDRVHLLP